MAVLTIFDLARLLLVFGIAYLALPTAALMAGGSHRAAPGGWQQTLASAFVRVCFFFQAAGLVLAGWRLYLPGTVSMLYLLWLAATAAFAARRVWVADSLPRPSVLLLHLFRWLEKRTAAPAWEAARGNWLRFLSSSYGALFGVLVAACAFRAAWFPIHNLRFQKLESYAKALSLHTMLRGEVWDKDPGIVLLGPLAMFSGLGADAAIRFSAPAVFAALLLAVAFVSWRYTRRMSTMYLAAAFMGGFIVWWRLMPIEPGGEEWTAVLTLFAVALVGWSWGDAALAAITALLVHPGLSPLLVGAALAVVGASLLLDIVPHPRAAGARRLAALAPLLAVMTAMLVFQPSPEHTAYQYEQSARTAARIAREFRTNDWIVISPGMEAAQTFGRGWHVELADFVEQYQSANLGDPGFRFPYTPASVFVFIEKRPLDQSAFNLAHDSGRAPYYYNTRMGRSSMQFRAGRMMADYARSHQETKVYYEDDQLIVYRIPRTAAN